MVHVVVIIEPYVAVPDRKQILFSLGQIELVVLTKASRLPQHGTALLATSISSYSCKSGVTCGHYTEYAHSTAKVQQILVLLFPTFPAFLVLCPALLIL